MNMRKHTLLLFLLLMAMPVLAENRSFRQAREIAERHAAKNGAHIGQQSVKRAKVLNKQHQPPVAEDITYFHMMVIVVIPSCRAMTECPKLWAIQPQTRIVKKTCQMA